MREKGEVRWPHSWGWTVMRAGGDGGEEEEEGMFARMFALMVDKSSALG